MNQKEAYDIIIQGGQSNAEGWGSGSLAKYAPYVPSEKVLYLDVEKEIVQDEKYMTVIYPPKAFVLQMAEERWIDGEQYGDLSLTFAEDYIKRGLLKDNRKLLILRGAIGGSSFWRQHWGLEGNVYQKMIEMTDYALRLNEENRVVAFLWHQGEGDTNHTSPDEYRQCLEDTLKDVRRRYGEMPFVSGNFVPEWIETRLEKCLAFAEVYRSLAERHAKAAFVETQGLLSNHQKKDNGDMIHFCRESLYELGHRYFDAFCKLI